MFYESFPPPRNQLMMGSEESIGVTIPLMKGASVLGQAGECRLESKNPEIAVEKRIAPDQTDERRLTAWDAKRNASFDQNPASDDGAVEIDRLYEELGGEG
jgi:hypothetical protein